ncbi:polyadenylate-binding protein 6 isoform X7 [Cannabis sativa]|uniref:polyadenylate-binding protein 6 isoform X7 n=1 Tax=Cannabis sativa TaxID=3483 RepID=UPI0029CA524E|nr:polyadenylate-binding protein 6 isoform X7 [Cannabis sativa]
MVAEVGAPSRTRRPPETTVFPVSEANLHKKSLYVGDLDPTAEETDLIETFRFMGPLASVRLCRDFFTGKSLCYAYVNFFSHSHASKALDCLNHTELKDLEEMFCKYGNIQSCKVAEANGISKGFGFVQFDSEDSAKAAVGDLHSTKIEGKKYVTKFVKKSERTATNEEETSFTNLFVKNIDKDISVDFLRAKFSQFGKVSNVVILKDYEGNSRGMGFVKFESPEDAMIAVERLNGSLLGSRHMYVERARKKPTMAGNKMLNSQLEKASNLHVTNLDILVDDNKLRKHFSCCGNITSVRVMRDENGVSKGFGFVRFSTHEEAKNALKTLDGTVLEQKSLRVTFAWQKDYHRKESQLHYPQQSLDIPNWDNASCSIPFVPYNFNPSPSLHSPLPYQPYEYLNIGNDVGHVQYPYLLQNYLQQFSTCVPTRQMQQPRHQNFRPSQSCVLTDI